MTGHFVAKKVVKSRDRDPGSSLMVVTIEVADARKITPVVKQANSHHDLSPERKGAGSQVQLPLIDSSADERRSLPLSDALFLKSIPRTRIGSPPKRDSRSPMHPVDAPVTLVQDIPVSSYHCFTISVTAYGSDRSSFRIVRNFLTLSLLIYARIHRPTLRQTDSQVHFPASLVPVAGIVK